MTATPNAELDVRSVIHHNVFVERDAAFGATDFILREGVVEHHEVYLMGGVVLQLDVDGRPLRVRCFPEPISFDQTYEQMYGKHPELRDWPVKPPTV